MPRDTWAQSLGTLSLKGRHGNNCWFNQCAYLVSYVLPLEQVSHSLVPCLPLTSLGDRDVITKISQMGTLRHLEDKDRRQPGCPVSTNLLLKHLVLDFHNKHFPSVSSHKNPPIFQSPAEVSFQRSFLGIIGLSLIFPCFEIWQYSEHFTKHLSNINWYLLLESVVLHSILFCTIYSSVGPLSLRIMKVRIMFHFFHTYRRA